MSVGGVACRVKTSERRRARRFLPSSTLQITHAMAAPGSFARSEDLVELRSVAQDGEVGRSTRLGAIGAELDGAGKLLQRERDVVLHTICALVVREIAILAGGRRALGQDSRHETERLGVL